MDIGVDHYGVLGLVWNGGCFSEKEIDTAYRLKAKEVHPDKRPNDPRAHSDFIRLQSSYAVLKDEQSRKAYDTTLKAQIRREEIERRKKEEEEKEKRRVEEREQRNKEEKEKRMMQLIDDMYRMRAASAVLLGMERVLKVSWEKKEDFSTDRLCKFFKKYGEVEDVVIRKEGGSGSALVVMATKAAALVTLKQY